MSEKIITWLVVAIIVCAGGYVTYEHIKDSGRKEVQAEWDADKDRQDKAAKAAIAKREAENAQVAAAQSETIKLIKQREANDKTHNDAVHVAVVDSMRNDPRSKSGRSAEGSSSKNTSEPDQANSGAWILSDARMQDLFALLRNADELASQCRAQQKFITDNNLIEGGENDLD